MTKIKREEFKRLLLNQTGKYLNDEECELIIPFIDQHFIEKDALAEEVRKMKVNPKKDAEGAYDPEYVFIQLKAHNQSLDEVLALLERIHEGEEHAAHRGMEREL